MRLIEIRDLDGPNLFLLEPAIKIELEVENDQDLAATVQRLSEVCLAQAIESPEVDPVQCLVRCCGAFIEAAHRGSRLDGVSITGRKLEMPNRLAIAFGWSHRRFALALARQLAMFLTGEAASPSPRVDELLDVLRTTEPDDRPLMITDRERRIPVVAVTGTNGKTTTTRLLAHILMSCGKRVGWSSTSGVYIDGDEVLRGDYSGPSGARRVLSDPSVDIGVLETARGGILLRGLACQSHDVSVFTNISADHLNLHGVLTVEGLAEVKAVAIRVTRPDGTAVLNGDDPLVLAATADVRAGTLLFSRDARNKTVSEHIARGGDAVWLEGSNLVVHLRGERSRLVSLTDVPSTFGGRARHMVENVMAAAGAAMGLGFALDQIAAGLRSFRSSASHNPGRLNVFDVDGATVIVDFAHNEAGLVALLDFVASLAGPGARRTVVIGTAGDRTDESLREIGRLAAACADDVIVKRTKKYERGRTNDEMIVLYRQGAAMAGRDDLAVAENELDGLRLALARSRPGDVIALMCQEQMDEIVGELQRIGKPVQ